MKTTMMMLGILLFTGGIAYGGQAVFPGPSSAASSSNEVRRGPDSGPPPEAFAACKNKKEGDRAQFVDPRGETVTGTCHFEKNRLVLRPDRPKDDSGNRPRNPPPEAYKACEGKKAGDRAELTDPQGETVTGTCEALDGKLVLRPDRPSGPPGNPPDAGSSAPPPTTASSNKTGTFNMEQTLSDGAQRNTIAFDGLAFLTGNLCSDAFLPPGKMADFFGFQYLRDNDPSHMGHNADFLTKIANNVFHILNDQQVEKLVILAKRQVKEINHYAIMRFPLMKAFRRLRNGDLPNGSTGLNRDAVMAYSAKLYRLDGQISLERAEVLGGILRSLDRNQRNSLNALVGAGMTSWPNLPDRFDRREIPHDVDVAVMTYASQLFSWYAGSVASDTYFCPERQGTYFGSFYLKDKPAMGNPDYTIGANVTADKGRRFLAALTTTQASRITGLVDLQRKNLNEIVGVRQKIATALRRVLTGDTVDENKVLKLSERYGKLDGEIAFFYATHFAEVGKTLTDSQMETLASIRDLNDASCSGAYLYSDPIQLPKIGSTDFLFGVAGSSTGQ